MKTLNQLYQDKIEKLLVQVKSGYVKDNCFHTVALTEFIGADIAYYTGERQIARYGLVCHVIDGQVYEMVIASMPCKDGSWGSGTYYNTCKGNSGFYTIAEVIDKYLELKQQYQGLVEIPA